ncbi:MAG: hypothetical protein LBT57_02550, partial [Puniceicoccales bacterium]|nr:hypothetical protein [Puniceicoccales bacterium]
MERVPDAVADFGELSSSFIDIWWPSLDPLSPKPQAVLLPSETAVENLKMACAQRGIILGNTPFFSPSELREFLKSSSNSCAQVQQGFRIIPEKTLKFWLRNILKASTRLQALKLQALREEAGLFLQTFALWRRVSPTRRRQSLFDSDFSFFAEQFEAFLAHQQAVLSIEEAYQYSEFKGKLFQNAFIGGFSPQNGNDLPLLRLCAQLSERVTFANLLSENFHRDRFWQSVTAHLKSEDAGFVADVPSPCREKSAGKRKEAFVSDEGDTPAFPSTHFSAETLDEEVAQVCGQLRVILGSRPKGRVAIILPSESSLENMLLQERLHREGIPFSSALLFPPRVRTYPIAHAWCRWQKSDRIDDYSQWVQRLFFGGFLNDSLRKSLEGEMSSGLIRLAWHSSGLLLDWVREKTGNGNLKDFLNLARLWPERADVPTFLDSLARIVDNGLWGSFPQEQRSTLFQELRPWSLMGQKCSRFSFIEWLEASLRECFSETPSYASPSAEVCLITPAEFDHGMWPCVFLLHSAERLGKRHPWSLNPFLQTTGRASRQKSSSEASHHSPLAGNTELGEEGHEQEPFLALNLKKIRRKYSGEHGYFFSISRANGDTDSPSVPIASPSPTESNDSASGPLRRKSPSPSSSGHPSTMPEPFGELKKIHRERRDPQLPFGAWDYSLGAPLGKYFTFPCKTWEALLCNPEEAWYRYLLGRGDFWDFPEADWRKIVLGTWVHDFLHFPEASENALNLP